MQFVDPLYIMEQAVSTNALGERPSLRCELIARIHGIQKPTEAP